MKRVLIWGSEGGIGQAILKKFQQEGWYTIAVARKLSSLSQAADLTFEADFSSGKDADQVAGNLEEVQGQIDAFVFAAGDIASEKVAEAGSDRWPEIIANNLTGVFQSLRVSLPLLKENGHIFILGAISERLQLPGLSAYAAAKAGLEAFAVALSKEERQKSITVVRPGAVDTDLWEKVSFKKPSHTFSPQQVADKILEAYQEGHKGLLDLA
jgi:NAD(P)-dependent dehydrogenase (short-subunit alcohol dehydrogenase family)